MKALHNILPKFAFPKEFIVVECYFGQEGEHLALCHFRVRREKAELLESRNGQSIDDLLKGFKDSIPIILLLSGKKVLTKKIEIKENLEEEQLISRAFSNIDTNQLLIQVNPNERNEFAISAVRLDIVDGILERIGEGGKMVIEICLSEYAFYAILDSVEKGKLGGYFNDINKADLSQIRDNLNGEIMLMGEKIDLSCLMPFLLGLQLLASNDLKSTYAPIISNREQWKYTMLFQKTLPISAVLIFVLLLLNFLAYTHYTQKNNELHGLTQAYNKQLTEISDLKNSFEAKKQFLLNNGGQNSKVAKMGDEIAMLLPKQITLSKMSFQPVTKVIKKDNLVRFAQDKMTVEGETDSYAHFQVWLDELRKLEWVSEIAIVGYQETNSRHDAEFSISIHIAGNG